MKSKKFRLLEQIESVKSGLPIPTDEELREFEKEWDGKSPVAHRLKLYATRRYIEGMSEVLKQMGESFLCK